MEQLINFCIKSSEEDFFKYLMLVVASDKQQQEFQDILDALMDAKDLVEDISLGAIIDGEKAEVVGELVNHALGIMERLGFGR